MLNERELTLFALDRWTRQRSGMDFADYGDVTSYRAEQRSITRDLHDFRALLAAVSWRDGIGAPELKEAFGAFSGRLTWDGSKLNYCVGQYFPTEYRKADCSVLASALWEYTRENMPAPDSWRVESYGAWNGAVFVRETSPMMQIHAACELLEAKGGQAYGSIVEFYKGKSAGEWLRSYFRKEFGRGIASRWFN
jgi:hypothetical protein